MAALMFYGPAKPDSKQICRARYACRASIQPVRVDHCCLHITVSQKLLKGSNVGSTFKQVGGKAMAKGMAAGGFADLHFPAAAISFSCALGVPINATDTPRLLLLMRRSMTDLGLSTYPAKNRYQRQRPFMVNNQPICTPADEQGLRGDGSYPSGHTAVGWGWGLILSTIAPERSDALIARGRAFGESRSICNVHWISDVQAGELMGSATTARLQADPVFQADLQAARQEVQALRARQAQPNGDCSLEEAALAIRP